MKVPLILSIVQHFLGTNKINNMTGIITLFKFPWNSNVGRLKLVFLADIHFSVPSIPLQSALLRQQRSYPSLNKPVTFSLGVSLRSCFEFKLPKTHPRTLDITREFGEDARWRDGLIAEL
jgi:hypothetical protein